jgi:hypothetical protein
MGLQRGEGAFFIGTHQSAIASDVCRENRCEAPFSSFLGHISHLPDAVQFMHVFSN